jgi:hypothetical protein
MTLPSIGALAGGMSVSFGFVIIIIYFVTTAIS